VHDQISGQLRLPAVVKALSEFSATRKDQALPSRSSNKKGGLIQAALKWI
jgi:hypothetical protein